MKHRLFIAVGLCAMLAGCSGAPARRASLDYSDWPVTPFTITSESELIGGPNAQGRVGDVLLANDRIRVIIQKPIKNAGVNSFGGNIIDADIVRQGPGQDNFGSIFPLVNIEWTVNYTDYEAISDGSGGSPKTLRAYGTIDVYDYLDMDFIGDVAEGVTGQAITFHNRFDDRRNPFQIYDDLRGMSFEVITDYTLEPGKNYVKVTSAFRNDGSQEVRLPMGHIINGSGQLSMLIPGVGFTPDLMTQVGANAPAIIYAAFDESDVSYGYFYRASQFADPESGEPLKTTTVSYSDVTGVLLGEEFLKLAPLGSGGTPEISFSIPAGGTRTIETFFVVGDGSAGSVMDAGLAAVGASARPFSARVEDASGSPVAGATVAVMHKGSTLVTYRTDSSGRAQGMLPDGGNVESRRFGDGKYKVIVEKPGYHANGSIDAGICAPAEINVATSPSVSVTCTLGESGRVRLSGPVTDSASGAAIPARLTIVGEDPSPNKVGGAGRFRSTYHWEQPFGVVDVKYITAKGTFDLTGSPEFNIEPGTYLLVVSRGPEYSIHDRLVEVTAGGSVTLEGVSLGRVAPTPGYIGADLHVHSIVSPDSMLSQKLRALSASAEALDVLQSTDHDFIADHSPFVEELVSEGLIPAGSIAVSAGVEVTPNHYGHLNVFPLIPDPAHPEGGAVDWSASPLNTIGPGPAYCLGLGELIDTLRAAPGRRQVVQVNHIMDNPTGLPLAAGWVTSPFYMEDFGVPPLSSYADPVERRMPPRSSGVSFPLEFGTSDLMSVDFDAMELVVGMHLNDPSLLYRSALPTWFNLLNLGVISTATASSDSHRVIANPVGLPRNFIASSVDPADGIGASHAAIGLDEYADSIRAGRVVVSAGPFLTVRAFGDSGAAEVGGTVTGRKISFEVEASAPSWAWFDTIEVYANTEPVPVDDDTDMPMQGTAADPAVFYRPYHVPRYTYRPERSFKLSDGTLSDWREEGGAITASVSFEMDVTEDTWVVVMARGTPSTDGYRSLFPVVTSALVDPGDRPAFFDPADLASFHADRRVGAPAWALANPVFIDVEGDGFTAKYVREGISPLSR